MLIWASGGIGRRVAFRALYLSGCGGSSPLSPTNKELIGFLEAKMRDALRASRILALQKPLSSILVSLLYQVRTYFQNKVR